MSKTVDLIGQKFGRLLVVARAGSDKRGEALWECECECGVVTVVLGSNLRTGHTRSCGCYNDERRIEVHTKHGRHGSRGNIIWAQMIQRCNNSNHIAYHRYGGRGIKVCEEWLKFENFFADMGDPPEEATLERVNNDGSYCKENCIWTSVKANARNRSSNVEITYEGRTQCIAAWEEELGFNYGTLWNRINTYKWPLEKAMTEPVTEYRGKVEFNGKYQTLTAHARDHGLNRTTVDARLLQGWTLEEALSAPARTYKSKKK